MTILTKTITPVCRKSLIRRQRLVDNLYLYLDYKLTLVTAAAGYGKTSLLVDFAHDCELPICWLTLDEADRDPAQFLSSFAASIAQIFPGFGSRTNSALGNGVTPEQVVGVFVNELVSSVPDLFVIILDDYHLADTEEVGRVLNRLLRFLPDHARIILSGRTLPDIDLIYLTAKQEVAALVPHELCFSPRETAKLLEQNHRLVVPEADARALTDKMKGWVTGIVLASQQLTRQLAMQPEEGTLDVIYAYLAQEVLALQPPHVRDFLLQTAILPWMTADMCNELLHRNDAIDVLRLLEARHLFVELVNEKGTARYRYHPLFREFLLERLEMWDPGRSQALHRRAAQIYVRGGEKEEAIRHLLLIGELDFAIPLIDSLAHLMFTAGRHATLLQWQEKLGDLADQAPHLQLNVARVYTDRGENSLASQLLQNLLFNPAAVPILPSVKIQIGHIQYRQGQVDRAIDTLQPLIDHGSKERIQAHALRITGLCLLQQGKPRDAKRFLLQSLDIYRRLRDDYDETQVLLDLPLALTRLGEIEAGVRYQAEALNSLREQQNTTSLTTALNNHACLLQFSGRFKEAETIFKEAEENALSGKQDRQKIFVTLGRADLYREVGNTENALTLYQQASASRVANDEPWLLDYAVIGMASCYRIMGMPAQARSFLAQSGTATDASLKAKVLVEKGMLLADADDFEAGINALSTGCQILCDQEAYPELAVAELYLCEIYRRSGNEGAAVQALGQAIETSQQYAERDVRFALEARNFPEALTMGDRLCVNPPALARLRERISMVGEACDQFDLVTLEKSSSSLQVFALGDGRVIRNGHEITSAEWKRAVSRLIFFYLIDRPPVQRNELARLFWPDVSANKAGSRLHSCVYSARKALAGKYLQFLQDQGSYQVDVSQDVWYDVREFEQTLTLARTYRPSRQKAKLLQRAVDLYSGPYMADNDEVWTSQRRRELEMDHLNALIELGDCYYADQDYEKAHTWYFQALDLDAFREDVHRRLILSLAKAGRRAEALRQYDECIKILHEELGVEPDPATQALVQQIRSS